MDNKHHEEDIIRQQTEEMAKQLGETEITEAQRFYLAGVMNGMKFQQSLNDQRSA